MTSIFGASSSNLLIEKIVEQLVVKGAELAAQATRAVAHGGHLDLESAGAR